LVPPRCGVGH